MPAPQQNWPVAIGEAARRAGVSARMVRHYESLGLLAPVHRTDSGYRQYTEADVHALRFIRRGRDLGFSMDEISTLLGLWQDQGRASSQVKAVAQRHIGVLTERIAAMQAMQRTLQSLVRSCHGDDRPDCPILDDLASAESSVPRETHARFPGAAQPSSGAPGGDSPPPPACCKMAD